MLGEIHDSLKHRPVQHQRRVGVDDGVNAGRGPERLLGQAPGDPHHLHAVGDLTLAAAIDEWRLGREDKLRAGDFQMAKRGIDILGFDIRALDMHDIVMLGQPHDVAAVLHGPGPFSAVEVRNMRRAPDRAPDDMPPAEDR